MYLFSRTLGELSRMHSGWFCYRSNNVWFGEEQGLVSFAEMKCQKCKNKMALTTPPLSFFRCIQSSFNMCVMIRTYEAAHSHSLPLSFFLEWPFWWLSQKLRSSKLPPSPESPKVPSSASGSMP